MTETQYDTLRERIAAEKAERQQRYAEYQRIYDNAVVAGRHAGQAHTPTPMIVSGYEDQPVMDGPCGFGWVSIRPGNSAFARWLTKQGYARKAYEGGVHIWISGYGQSYERKVAHAQAMAEVFRTHFPELRIYGTGRLD